MPSGEIHEGIAFELDFPDISPHQSFALSGPSVSAQIKNVKRVTV